VEGLATILAAVAHDSKTIKTATSPDAQDPDLTADIQWRIAEKSVNGEWEGRGKEEGRRTNGFMS